MGSQRASNDDESAGSGTSGSVLPSFAPKSWEAADAHDCAPTPRVRDVSDWIGEILQVWSRGGTQTLDLARLVFAARRRLGYGEWAELWKSGEMPFSKRKGEMLVVIGERMGRIDAQTFAHLPTGWSVLYWLARLEQATLKQLVEQGTVHPRLTLREARELVARYRGRPCRDVSHEDNFTRRLAQFRSYVERHLGDWTPDERERARTELARLLQQIDGAKSRSASVDDLLPPILTPHFPKPHRHNQPRLTS